MAVEPIGAALRERFGIAARVIRHVRSTKRTEVCEIECDDPVDFADPSSRDDRRIVDAWRATAPRAPWERPGWFAEACAWLEGILGPAAVTPVKGAWPGSSVLRAETARGRFFMKAIFEKPPFEGDVIALLAQRFPDNVPRVLAADRERRWLLLEDFGGDLPSDAAPDALRTFAALQIAFADDDLFRIDAPDFRPARLVDRVRTALASSPRPPGRAIGRVAERAAELERSPVGPSIVHQDFRLGNIAAGQVFYDWSDTVVSHPFFSAVRFLDYVEGPDDLDDPSASRRRELRDAYLEPWAERFGADVVQRDFATCWVLQGAFQVARWYRELRYLDPATPWATYFPGMLRAYWDLTRRRVAAAR